MQAPWKALHSNNYDDALKLSVPAEIADAPSGKSDASGSHEQVYGAVLLLVEVYLLPWSIVA